MMGRWKTCFKLLKYSHNYKRSIWGAIIFFLIGLGLFVGVAKLNLSFVIASVVCILVSFTMLLQLKEDLICSAMVCTSSKRRFFNIRFSDFLLVSAGVITYLIFGILVFLFLKNEGVEEYYALNVLMVSSLCIAVFMVFLSMYPKYYWSSCITIWFLNILFMDYLDSLEDAGKALLSVSTPIGFWMGLGVVLAGGVFSVIIRRILYKKPLSKWIVREYLKKMG